MRETLPDMDLCKILWDFCVVCLNAPSIRFRMLLDFRPQLSQIYPQILRRGKGSNDMNNCRMLPIGGWAKIA